MDNLRFYTDKDGKCLWVYGDNTKPVYILLVGGETWVGNWCQVKGKVIEMTITDVEKLLGYKVRIVGEI